VVDGAILQLLDRRYFTTGDFHETRAGACRLLAPLSHDLAALIPTYAAAVAPIAERTAHAIARTSPGQITLTTPLSRSNTTGAQTRGQRSAHRRTNPTAAVGRRTCRMCGTDLYGAARQLCPTCWPIARYDASSAAGEPTTMAGGHSSDTGKTSSPV
jgi:hypothetical protein